MRHKNSKGASYWREQIRAAAAHTDGVRSYCEKNGIQRQAFYYWKKRLRGGGPLRRAGDAFAKVEVVGAAPADGPALRGTLPDPRWLAEFLLVLGAAR